MSFPHWHPGDIVGVTHSNVTVSKWDVSSLLESGEQRLERGFEEMSFGAGCQLWSHTCAQGMGVGGLGGKEETDKQFFVSWLIYLGFETGSSLPPGSLQLYLCPLTELDSA